MNKRKADKTSNSTDGPILPPPLDGKVRAAIQRVFRFTHGRDMTTEERRVFGIEGEVKKDRRSSKNHHDRDGF